MSERLLPRTSLAGFAFHPADRAVFWGTTLLCALAALILPLAG